MKQLHLLARRQKLTQEMDQLKQNEYYQLYLTNQELKIASDQKQLDLHQQIRQQKEHHLSSNTFETYGKYKKWAKRSLLATIAKVSFTALMLCLFPSFTLGSILTIATSCLGITATLGAYKITRSYKNKYAKQKKEQSTILHNLENALLEEKAKSQQLALTICCYEKHAKPIIHRIEECEQMIQRIDQQLANLSYYTTKQPVISIPQQERTEHLAFIEEATM